jgi:hypothetical protein
VCPGDYYTIPETSWSRPRREWWAPKPHTERGSGVGLRGPEAAAAEHKTMTEGKISLS